MNLNPISEFSLTPQVSKDDSSAQPLSMRFSSSSFKNCKWWPLALKENSRVINCMHVKKVLSISEAQRRKSHIEDQKLGPPHTRNIKSKQNHE